MPRYHLRAHNILMMRRRPAVYFWLYDHVPYALYEIDSASPLGGSSLARQPNGSGQIRMESLAVGASGVPTPTASEQLMLGQGFRATASLLSLRRISLTIYRGLWSSFMICTAGLAIEGPVGSANHTRERGLAGITFQLQMSPEANSTQGHALTET